MALFRGKKKGIPQEEKIDYSEKIKRTGTMLRAVVTDVCVKRNGYVVSAIYEDRWLGTQYKYTSNVLTEMPRVYIGGEVTVYVDNINSDGLYYVDCSAA